MKCTKKETHWQSHETSNYIPLLVAPPVSWPLQLSSLYRGLYWPVLSQCRTPCRIGILACGDSCTRWDLLPFVNLHKHLSLFLVINNPRLLMLSCRFFYISPCVRLLAVSTTLKAAITCRVMQPASDRQHSMQISGCALQPRQAPHRHV